MTSKALTIGQTIEELHQELCHYIEATYHISEPNLISQRRALLDVPGVIHQRPFLESTPRYISGGKFESLGLATAVQEIFDVISGGSRGGSPLAHDPPYEHQGDAIVRSLRKERSLVVMTATGSGKTECFLWPILGKLATEARRGPSGSFSQVGVRAILLYPMNALVNDQLGRLRLLFGDQDVAGKFKEWSGRPARFARYTSRTLYPGVRSVKKDRIRLKAIGDYYVRHLERAEGLPSEEQEASAKLVYELRQRGKWPAKPDLLAWYGRRNTRWQDSSTGEFKRCVTLPDDAELLTRHEVLQSPPDVLVTNYSMLEYMLMRPIERPVFDATRDWLAANPDEKLLLVIDEAHLYRGAAGAEVALLIRRLRSRLGLPPERLQVICTSASFADPDYASEFAAALSGKHRKDFDTIEGKLALRDPDDLGSREDAEILAQIDLSRFYGEEGDDVRLEEVKPFLEYRGVKDRKDLQRSLYDALEDYAPMGRLINMTMREARPVDSLGVDIFGPLGDGLEDRAVTRLIALGSLARREAETPSLLPCRVHSFFRGLPGLWVCMDSSCSELPDTATVGPAGKLYSQPRDMCGCGARVLELYTCRNCGAAYGRAYVDDLDEPDFVWAEPGSMFRTLTDEVRALQPLDLLLEDPIIGDVEPAEFDLVTGRINPTELRPRNRLVYMRKDRSKPSNEDADGSRRNSDTGEFRPCGVCGQTVAFGRSTVQDHQTKGDQPLQALIAKQIQVQAPSSRDATPFAPHRGRKVLVFSDSRQTAARLAPNLQLYSTRDALRPLLIRGYKELQNHPLVAPLLTLEDMFLALLLAAAEFCVRLRPELKEGETFNDEAVVADAVKQGALTDDNALLGLLVRLRSGSPPASILRAMLFCLSDRYYGFESLALASIVERSGLTEAIRGLPDVPGVAESPEQKVALGRVWLRSWHRYGYWLSSMPPAWYRNEVGGHTGRFAGIGRLLASKEAKRVFEREWGPNLLAPFTEPAGDKHRILGRELSLLIGGDWAYCRACRTTQRPYPDRATCVNCLTGQAVEIDPSEDPVFRARKSYFRTSTLGALKDPPESPMALIAAEHTAQLNAARAGDVFSKAEEHELLFQDVDLGASNGDPPRPAIDVLSCTTTMEVGIDIGKLSGVALRNMPPARANYQQRSGRAGRRGTSVATVTAFGSADSHDEHYFTHPEQMIRGPSEDPRLTLDNHEIARRHVTAYLLQRYHQDRLPTVDPEPSPGLFAVLGTVAEFKRPSSALNRYDLAEWLESNHSSLRNDVDSWLPHELPGRERTALLDTIVDGTLAAIDEAIGSVSEADAGDGSVDASGQNAEDETGLEVVAEEGEEQPGASPGSANLLDRLLYKGVLPRYAFPTDVATFHVFDADRSSPGRHVFQYSPSQGLAVALSQYAPGKEVWIGSKLWTSGALYSPFNDDRYNAWLFRKLYFECRVCGYAKTIKTTEGERREIRDCEACGRGGTFGEAQFWLCPPGFAHPVFLEEGTTPDDQPSRSYATRAKLSAQARADPDLWSSLNDRVRVHFRRDHLLVTNSGPRREGYTYCTNCGLIEPTAAAAGFVVPSHRKPYPDDRDPICEGSRITRGLVLGTDFISDILLISLAVEPPLTLVPGILATDVALRTLCEALGKAGCGLLELEPGELQAEHRPALTEGGPLGTEAEIYIYDTLPGGAGFAQRVGNLGLRVFVEALRILESCPDDCDRSCYRCLRSYKNKLEHEMLDRHLGASLLRYLIHGSVPKPEGKRLDQSTDMLFEDLMRQRSGRYAFERNAQVQVPGVGDLTAPILVTKEPGVQCVVALHGPLTPDEPPTDALRELKEYSIAVPLILVDELVVRRNLPRATSDLMKDLGA